MQPTNHEHMHAASEKEREREREREREIRDVYTHYVRKKQGVEENSMYNTGIGVLMTSS